MARTIDNTDDVIDSRDVIARIEELRAEHCDEGGEILFVKAGHDESNEALEYFALVALAEQGESLADWEHGAALIRESYFERYAMELAEDIGAINRDATWPNNCIDWERAARELLMDYTSLDFDGVTYYVRS